MTEARWKTLTQQAIDDFNDVSTEVILENWDVEKRKLVHLIETIDEITFIFNMENKKAIIR